MFKFLKGSTQFWSPISYAWGLAVLLLGLTYLILVGQYIWLGWLNVGFGIAFILIGVSTTSPFNKQIWAGLLLRFSIPVIFFGITTSRTDITPGWIIIIIGLILLVVGKYFSPK
jgi:hypothetical protein